MAIKLDTFVVNKIRFYY